MIVILKYQPEKTSLNWLAAITGIERLSQPLLSFGFTTEEHHAADVLGG